MQHHEEFYNLSDDMIVHTNSRIKSEVGKIYPNVDLDDKFLLVINSDLFFPHSDEVSGEIILRSVDKKNDEVLFTQKPVKTKIRKPYWNKYIRKISAQNGNRYCNIGIPYLFDSFEEMTLINEIFIIWRFSAFELMIKYDVSFERIEGINKYFMQCKDMPFESMPDDEQSNKILMGYLNEYDIVLRHQNNTAVTDFFLCREDMSVTDIMPMFKDLFKGFKEFFEPDTVTYYMKADERLIPRKSYFFCDTKSG